MAFQKKLPTSAKGAVSFVQGSGRTAVWVAMIVLGLGLFAFVMPFLSRVPLLGPLMNQGRNTLPGASAMPTTDQWGRIRG